MIPLAGKLSDQFGRKPFLLVGALLFLLGSACAGLAQDMNQLIAFRLLQGVGAGIGISLVFTVLGDLFAPKERIRWQGLFTGVYGVTNLVGPALGGWLTQRGPLMGSLVTDATRWHWIFYINLSIGVIVTVALIIGVPSLVSSLIRHFLMGISSSSQLPSLTETC